MPLYDMAMPNTILISHGKDILLEHYYKHHHQAARRRLLTAALAGIAILGLYACIGIKIAEGAGMFIPK